MRKSIFFLLISFLFNITCVLAQWNTTLTINTPVAVAAKAQQNTHTVSDALGGIIVVWEDNRNSATTSTDIYAQRMNASGLPKWTSNGLAVCSATLIQKSISMTQLSDGGVIIIWEDNRNGNSDIYAQKIDSMGNIKWAGNGVAICSVTTAQKNPKIINDGSDGAIIVWEDSLNFYWDITAQHISSSGALLWAASGVDICSAPNTQNNPKIDIDNNGGAIITWQDKRNNLDYDIYAQRINSLGAVQWATNGVVICNAINTQSNPRIDPDGAGGAAIAWEDKRNGLDYDVYLQRINSSGITQWVSNGVLVCGATSNQSAIDMKYIGPTGFVISWKDKRSGNYAIYSQLLNLSGVPQLATNGVMLSSALMSINPNAISDGAGGAIIAWQDSVAVSSWNITSQKMNSAGVLQWAAGGVPVSLASDSQINADQVSDGNGGAVYAWDDHRNGSDYDIFAQHLFNTGNAFVGINELSNNNSLRALCYPNPVCENSVIQLNGNSENSTWEIVVYNSYGETVDRQKLPANRSYEVSASELTIGYYFYVVTLTGSSSGATGQFMLVK